MKTLIIAVAVLAVLAGAAEAKPERKRVASKSWGPFWPTAPPNRLFYFEEMDDGAPGWHSQDESVQPSRFNITTYFACDLPDHVGPQCYWCGEQNGAFAGGDGYGDYWDQRLDIPPTDVSMTTFPILTFKGRYDSETAYDFTYVQAESAGVYVNLNRGFDGPSGGWFDLGTYGFAIGQYDNPAKIRFRFVSDGSWSDEDGFYDSDAGACHFDDIKIFDFYGGSVCFLDDVDGTGGLCTAVVPEAAGDWWHLSYDLCSSFTQPYSWWCGDPADTSLIPPNLRDALYSPVIDVSGAVTCTVRYVAHTEIPTFDDDYWRNEVSLDGGVTWHWLGSLWGDFDACDGWCQAGRDAGFDVTEYLSEGTDLVLKVTLFTTENGCGPGSAGGAGLNLDRIWVEGQAVLPEILVEPESFWFSVYEGGSECDALTIGNEGDAELTWSIADALDWLTATPSSGGVAPGETDTIEVCVDAGGLAADDFSGALSITSNDPDNPMVAVLVNLTVVAAADIALTPPTLSLHVTAQGAGCEELVVSNLGSLDLTWSIADACPWLTSVPGGGVTSSGESDVVDVCVDASGMATGEYGCDLVVGSNDPDEPNVVVPVTLTVREISDLRAFVLFENDSNVIMPDPYTPFSAYVCFEGFEIGEGLAGAVVRLHRTFEAVMMSYDNLLGDLQFGDPESADGWEVYASECVMPDEGVVTAGRVDYLFLGGPGTLELLPHSTWGRLAINCDIEELQWCVRSDPSGHGGVWMDPPPGECLGPQIEVLPVSLSFELPPGGTECDTLAISNMGEADLSWSAAEECSWLVVNPTAGIVSPGSLQGCGACVDAAGLGPGYYECDIVLSSSDPDEPEVSVEVSLTVLAPPDIEVVPEVLAFELEHGEAECDSLVITNAGEGALLWSVSDTCGWLEGSPSGGEVSPGASENVA